MSKDEKNPQPQTQQQTQQSQADTVATAVEKVLEKTLPAVMAAGINAANNAAQQARAPQAPVVRESCGICRQPNMACKGKHVKMAVYPQSRSLGKSWSGVGINGVWYQSASPNHPVDVPADAPIAHMIQEWERAEMEMRQGREFDHNSGSIGPGGAAFNPAVGPMRE
jgi:hypothetical protein